MSFRNTLVLAGLILACTASQTTAAPKLTPGQPIPAGTLETFVDGAVADAMAVDHIAGVAVAVVQPDGQVFLKGYGDAGRGRAVDPRLTLFRIASISKTFTWIALMREVEAGRIRLDTPVNAYLPLKLRIPDQGFKRPIRIIDLMDHAAGFEDKSFGRGTTRNPADQLSLEDALARYRPDRVREPGVLSSYSNYGAALAGYIAARSAKTDFPTLMEREILTPLGMASTTFREPDGGCDGCTAPMPAALTERLSTGFAWSGGEYRPGQFEFTREISPAGAASATAADMALYMRAQLQGGAPLYGAVAAKAFRTPILNMPEGVNGWAHGFMIRPLPGGYLSYGHGGSLTTFFSNMALIPDLGTGVFVATNTSTGKPFAERLPALIVKRFYVAESLPTKLAGDPALFAQADRYAGAYFTTRRAYSGLEAFGALIEDGDRVVVSKDGYLTTRIGSTAHAWVPDGGPGRFRDAWGGAERLVFTLDADGRAVRFPGARGTFSLERAGVLLDPVLFKLAAALTLFAALARIAALCIAPRRSLRGAPSQRRAAIAALMTSGLWLVAFAGFGWWLGHHGDSDPWPNPLLVTASSAALLAAIGALVLLVLTPPALGVRGEEGGWGLRTKIAYTVSVALFLTFAILVAVRGGLTPWA
jgi:CubicO group peptidase (beta-lactamase class C family)